MEVSEPQRPLRFSPRPVSHAKREAIANIGNDIVAKSIIVPSTSEWASVVVLVPKPNGESHLCIDCRLHRIPSYPLSRMHQALDALQGKLYFSCFDLLKATGK